MSPIAELPSSRTRSTSVSAMQFWQDRHGCTRSVWGPAAPRSQAPSCLQLSLTLTLVTQQTLRLGNCI